MASDVDVALNNQPLNIIWWAEMEDKNIDFFLIANSGFPN